MRSEARTVVALFGGAAMLVLAVGCGGGTKGPSSSTTPMTTPSSSVAPAPSTAPGTGGGGTVPGGPTGGGGPGGGGGTGVENIRYCTAAPPTSEFALQLIPLAIGVIPNV